MYSIPYMHFCIAQKKKSSHSSILFFLLFLLFNRKFMVLQLDDIIYTHSRSLHSQKHCGNCRMSTFTQNTEPKLKCKREKRTKDGKNTFRKRNQNRVNLCPFFLFYSIRACFFFAIVTLKYLSFFRVYGYAEHLVKWISKPVKTLMWSMSNIMLVLESVFSIHFCKRFAPGRNHDKKQR